MSTLVLSHSSDTSPNLRCVSAGLVYLPRLTSSSMAAANSSASLYLLNALDFCLFTLSEPAMHQRQRHRFPWPYLVVLHRSGTLALRGSLALADGDASPSFLSHKSSIMIRDTTLSQYAHCHQSYCLKFLQ